MTIDEQIKKADAKIAEIEAALIVAQEHRRELVNRGNLNKCGYAGALYCLWGAGIMTTTVTKESLTARITELESGARSLKEDYTLAAYKMLLATMEAEPVAYSLIFRNMDGALNNFINTNTTFATRVQAEAYGKGGTYETRSDGRLEWVPNTALDPVVVPLYRHAQPAPVVPEEIKRNPETGWYVGPDGKNWSALQANSWNACRAAMLNQK